MDIVRTNLGFLGMLGAFASFSICCFLLSGALQGNAFAGTRGSHLSFREAVFFALQMIVDSLPIDLENAFGLVISSVQIANGYWPIRVFAVSYQLLLFLSVGELVVHLYKVRRDSP